MSQEAANDAVRRRSLFNIIQPGAGLTVDVIALRPSEFNSMRFARARRVRAGEVRRRQRSLGLGLTESP